MAARKYGAILRVRDSKRRDEQIDSSPIQTLSAVPLELDRLALDERSGSGDGHVLGQDPGDEEAGDGELGEHCCEAVWMGRSGVSEGEKQARTRRCIEPDI